MGWDLLRRLADKLSGSLATFTAILRVSRTPSTLAFLSYNGSHSAIIEMLKLQYGFPPHSRLGPSCSLLELHRMINQLRSQPLPILHGEPVYDLSPDEISNIFRPCLVESEAYSIQHSPASFGNQIELRQTQPVVAISEQNHLEPNPKPLNAHLPLMDADAEAKSAAEPLREVRACDPKGDTEVSGLAEDIVVTMRLDETHNRPDSSELRHSVESTNEIEGTQVISTDSPLEALLDDAPTVPAPTANGFSCGPARTGLQLDTQLSEISTANGTSAPFPEILSKPGEDLPSALDYDNTSDSSIDHQNSTSGLTAASGHPIIEKSTLGKFVHAKEFVPKTGKMSNTKVSPSVRSRPTRPAVKSVPEHSRPRSVRKKENKPHSSVMHAAPSTPFATYPAPWIMPEYPGGPLRLPLSRTDCTRSYTQHLLSIGGPHLYTNAAIKYLLSNYDIQTPETQAEIDSVVAEYHAICHPPSVPRWISPVDLKGQAVKDADVATLITVSFEEAAAPIPVSSLTQPLSPPPHISNIVRQIVLDLKVFDRIPPKSIPDCTVGIIPRVDDSTETGVDLIYETSNILAATTLNISKSPIDSKIIPTADSISHHGTPSKHELHCLRLLGSQTSSIPLSHEVHIPGHDWTYY